MIASAVGNDIRLAQVHLKHQVPIGSDPQRFICIECGRRLPEGAFMLAGVSPSRSGLGKVFYLYPDCMGCFRLKKSKLSRHPMWSAELHRFAKKLVRNARAGAPSRGLIFAITEDDVLAKYYAQGGRCALTGEKLTFEAASIALPRANRRSMSLDRIDSGANYTRDNVHLVCWAINQMKGSMSDDELRYWCAKIVLRFAADDESDAA